jgi:hypothetical protein
LKEVDGETKTYEPLQGATQHVPAGTRKRRLDRTNSGVDNIISQEDVHNRLMKRYKDAPLSWYLATFVIMLAVGIFVVE